MQGEIGKDRIEVSFIQLVISMSSMGKATYICVRNPGSFLEYLDWALGTGEAKCAKF